MKRRVLATMIVGFFIGLGANQALAEDQEQGAETQTLPLCLGAGRQCLPMCTGSQVKIPGVCANKDVCCLTTLPRCSWLCLDATDCVEKIPDEECSDGKICCKKRAVKMQESGDTTTEE